MAHQYRSWFFTYWTDETLDSSKLVSYVKSLPTTFTYITEDKGEHPEYGKTGKHIHMFIQFEKRKTFTALKNRTFKSFPTLHFESERYDAYEYCVRKQAEGFVFFTSGNRITQGDRTDLSTILSRFRNKEITLDNVRDLYPNIYVMYRKSFFSLIRVPDFEVPQVVEFDLQFKFVSTMQKDDTDYFIYNGSWSGYSYNDHIYICVETKKQLPFQTWNLKMRNFRVNVGYESILFRSKIIYLFVENKKK